MLRLSIFFRNLRSINITRPWVEQNRPVLIRFTGWSIVLLLCLFISRQVAIGNNLIGFLIAGAFIGLIGLGFLFKYQTLPMILIVPASFFLAAGINTGTATQINAVVLLIFLMIGIWLVDGIVVRREFDFFPSTPILPTVLLLVAVLISFLFGQLPYFPVEHASIAAQLGATMIFVLAVGSFFITSQRLTPNALRWFTWLFLAFAAVYVLARALIGIAMPVVQLFRPGSVGSLFWVWALAMISAQLYHNNQLKSWTRVFLWMSLALLIYVSVFVAREWTSGWLPPMIALAVLLWISLPNYRYLIILAGLVVVAIQWNNIVSMVMIGDNEYSMVTRLDAWAILFKIIKANPVFGVGPANYYFYTSLFPIRGYYVQFNSHNNYIDLLAQTGIVGTACYIWFIIEMLRLGMKLRGRTSNGFDRAYVYGAIGGIAGTATAGLLGDWVLPFIYNVGYEGFRSSVFAWMFMGGLISIERFLALESKDSDPESP